MRLAKQILLALTLIVIGYMMGDLQNIPSTDISDKSALTSRAMLWNENIEIRTTDSNEHKYINPLLECGDIEALSNAQSKNVKIAVEKLIKKARSDGDLNHASVYFRNLKDGPWFGIEEKQLFMPGSLLKVPLLMALLKETENNPDFLNQKILVENLGSDFNPHFKPSETILADKIYTVEDLINFMIKYSDNHATGVLSQILDEKISRQVFNNLGIETPSSDNMEYRIPVKIYASFFRILYNATYLNQDLSEKALNLLTLTDFNKGLRRDIPVKIPVAHKFGEKILKNNEKQLHDCGIIYHPNKPYILCVMTRGQNFEKMADVIAEISKTVYGFMN